MPPLEPWPRDPRILVDADGFVIGARGRIRRPYLNPQNGYYAMSMTEATGTHYLHSVVCETFHGPRPPGMEVAHENGVRTDCRAANLSWKTRSDNHRDKRRHGTNNNGTPVGEKNWRAVLTEDDVRRIRWDARVEPIRSIARRYGMDRTSIAAAIRGETWAHVAPEFTDVPLSQLGRGMGRYPFAHRALADPPAQRLRRFRTEQTEVP